MTNTQYGSVIYPLDGRFWCPLARASGIRDGQKAGLEATLLTRHRTRIRFDEHRAGTKSESTSNRYRATARRLRASLRAKPHEATVQESPSNQPVFRHHDVHHVAEEGGGWKALVADQQRATHAGPVWT